MKRRGFLASGIASVLGLFGLKLPEVAAKQEEKVDLDSLRPYYLRRFPKAWEDALAELREGCETEIKRVDSFCQTHLTYLVHRFNCRLGAVPPVTPVTEKTHTARFLAPLPRLPELIVNACSDILHHLRVLGRTEPLPYIYVHLDDADDTRSVYATAYYTKTGTMRFVEDEDGKFRLVDHLRDDAVDKSWIDISFESDVLTQFKYGGTDKRFGDWFGTWDFETARRALRAANG